jgi:CBS domain-containing protein
MKRQVPITEVMTTEIVSVDVGQPLTEVYHALQRASFEHVPVLDGDKPVGMISSTDVLRLVYDIDSADDRMLTTMLDHQFNIEDVMSTNLVSLPDSATIHDASEVLAEGGLHSVLVLDITGSLAGIVTTTDLVRYLRDL